MTELNGIWSTNVFTFFFFTFELLVTFFYPDFLNWLVVLYTLLYNETNDITNFIAFWNVDLQVYTVTAAR